MNHGLTAPFFEIGPKNLLRLAELGPIARAAGRAGGDSGVTTVLTVPTAFVAPVARLRSGVRVFAQGMDLEPLGDSMNRVTADALADAGATGVMLNHVSAPLPQDQLAVAVGLARAHGLLTIVCAGTEAEAMRFAALGPSSVLYEPPQLIGTVGSADRAWVSELTAAIHREHPGVLAMHAGGVASPSIAAQIMAAGADGTGSTSGVLFADDRIAAVADFIAAARSGWDAAQRRSSDLSLPTNTSTPGDPR